MEKPQVIMAEFQHETNCFSPTKAGRREFEERILIDSEEIIPFYKGTKTVVGGFIKASEVEAFEIMPVIAACAEPCGLITKDMFEFVKNKIIRAIELTFQKRRALPGETGADGLELVPLPLQPWA